MTGFASNTLKEHLARGVVGAGAVFGIATVSASSFAWWAVPVDGALVVTALVALRGCPMCWSIGLIETAKVRLRRR